MRPELIQATELLRTNTPEAIEEAIGLLQNTVYSFSMKVCGHPEDTEDTMQEVLYRSLRHLDKLQDPQALGVWLYTVTRNRCWRMRRKSANAPKAPVALDELMPDDAELGRLLEDAARSPESNVLHSEQSHLLHQAVLKISAPLRMVLVLHDMEELVADGDRPLPVARHPLRFCRGTSPPLHPHAGIPAHVGHRRHLKTL